MQERTLEQERKGLEQGVNNYLCLSAAKKLSKTITFSDKKWSNVLVILIHYFFQVLIMRQIVAMEDGSSER